MTNTFITNTTRRSVPAIPFGKIKDEVLDKRYELSLVLCGSALSRRLNRELRGKDKPANVLSLPLSKNSGEIFINLSQTGEFSAAELFIHALCHLKGMAHGRKMEEVELKILKKFINGTASRSRHRHRHLKSQGSHCR